MDHPGFIEPFGALSQRARTGAAGWLEARTTLIDRATVVARCVHAHDDHVRSTGRR